MSRYIVIGHWGETIVREPADATEPCTNDGDHPGHERCAQRVATVDSGAPKGIAQRICALLNGDQARIDSDGFCNGHTPDVDHTRGAAEALALVRRRLTLWDQMRDSGERLDPELAFGILRAAAVELGVDGDAPSGRAVSPQAAQSASGVVGSGSDLPKPAEGECDCGHEGLPTQWHSRPCPLAASRFARGGRIPPPSSTAPADSCTCVYRPNGGTDPNCPVHRPRHGAVI